MKVLFINSVCGIRSTGRIVTDLAERYLAEGHEVRAAYGRENVPERYREMSYRIGTENHVKLNALQARFFDNEGFNGAAQTKEFLKWADAYGPDLLWLHNLHGYYLNIELLFDWIKSRPQMKVYWTLHDCWTFTGHCAHFAFVGCQQWKTGCRSCIQKNEYPKRWGMDHCKENYRRKKEAFCGVKDMTLIVPSQWLADLTRESFLGEYPVKVVHNTIDTEVFRPRSGDFRAQYGLEDKKIVLGVASAWNEQKGLKDFIKLSEMLDPSYAVVLIGLTPKQLKALPSSVIGIERTNSAIQLAEVYTAADVFVNLTYEDTYPTVNLEAQACGTPCLTYRTGGSVESVPPEHVVEQGDLEGMIEQIYALCAKGK